MYEDWNCGKVVKQRASGISLRQLQRCARAPSLGGVQHRSQRVSRLQQSTLTSPAKQIPDYVLNRPFTSFCHLCFRWWKDSFCIQISEQRSAGHIPYKPAESTNNSQCSENQCYGYRPILAKVGGARARPSPLSHEFLVLLPRDNRVHVHIMTIPSPDAKSARFVS